MNNRKRIEKALSLLTPVPGSLAARRITRSRGSETDSILVGVRQAIVALSAAAKIWETIDDRRA